ncbi:hypothetical protein [Orrella daihaiensis]|uniref:Carbamoyl-phosphate synthase n=1 Tax=Orrella daihaiensis TaxID=2782176 RepID=A0ABY4APH2_9BURK|nr:hypothetical protein [Orrella daihaiensis]UOD51290.1 carbamoyl-phosphate synthase [Orrella daihaiensis]
MNFANSGDMFVRSLAKSMMAIVVFSGTVSPSALASEYGAYLYGQAQSQGAGTPNQLSVGGFVSLHQGERSLSFVDVQLGLELSDISGYSSIINTDVAGGTLATSTRLGHRWLSESGLWMFGIYTGYDTRAVKSGGSDQPGVNVLDPRTVHFEQIALGFEAAHQQLRINGYALLPIGDKEQALNEYYNAGALNTYGLDFGWSVTSKWRTTLGAYYQENHLEAVNGWGLFVGAQYALTEALSFGASYSNDRAFNGRLMAQLTYRFGANSSSARTGAFDLTKPVQNRNIRVHDNDICERSDPHEQRYRAKRDSCSYSNVSAW